jgi:hypothetical protein
MIDPKCIYDGNVTIDVTTSYTYTGSQIVPDVSVTYNQRTWVKDTDYTVTVTAGDNVNAGTFTIEITGIGNFGSTCSGSSVHTITIHKAKIPEGTPEFGGGTRSLKTLLVRMELAATYKYKMALDNSLPATLAAAMGDITGYTVQNIDDTGAWLFNVSNGNPSVINTATEDTLVIDVNSVIVDGESSFEIKVESRNYEDHVILVEVVPLARTVVNIALQHEGTKIYDAQPYAVPAVALSAPDLTSQQANALPYTIAYTGTQSTSYSGSTPPTHVGTYMMQVRINTADYAGVQTVYFTILPRRVSVQILNETVQQGAPLPAPRIQYNNFISKTTALVSNANAAHHTVLNSSRTGTFPIVFNVMPTISNLHGDYLFSAYEGTLTVLSIYDGCFLLGARNPAFYEIEYYATPKQPGNINGRLTGDPTYAGMLDMIVSPGATWKVYSDVACTQEVDRYYVPTGDEKTLYVKVFGYGSICTGIFELTLQRYVASTPGGYLRRQVVLPKVPGAVTTPDWGIHYSNSFGRFTFTIAPLPGYASSHAPEINTGSAMYPDNSNLTVVKNVDGSYSVTIHGVQEDLRPTITWDMDISSGNDPTASAIRVWSVDDRLHIVWPQGGEARIYSVAGQLLQTLACSAGETVTPLHRGFYVVTLNNGKTFKVIAK